MPRAKAESFYVKCADCGYRGPNRRKLDTAVEDQVRHERKCGRGSLIHSEVS